MKKLRNLDRYGDNESLTESDHEAGNNNDIICKSWIRQNNKMKQTSITMNKVHIYLKSIYHSNINLLEP